MLTFGSVCSGIEAASVAWEPLDWKAGWLAEIEKFPSAVLSHHYPSVPNLGDMTAIADRIRAGEIIAPDVLVGGTPCQAFSVAGARAGLSDPRGQLTLSYVDLANAIDSARAILGKPSAIIVWENVPGVLSSKDNAFGCFLGALAGEGCELRPPGGKWKDAGCVYGPERAIAWRVCDAQYFGVAQRRRRVFVVASARKGFDPSEILFEFDGVRRDSAPSREAGKEAAAAHIRGADGDSDVDHPQQIACMAHGQGGAEIRTDGGAPCLTCNHEAPIVVRDIHAGHQAAICITGDITHTLKAEGFDASEDGTGRGQPIVTCTIKQLGHSVRRLTPRECERLQAFPDDYTLIAWRGRPIAECPDGPRYKALGNSMCVYNMRWIGRRIDTYLRHAIDTLVGVA